MSRRKDNYGVCLAEAFGSASIIADGQIGTEEYTKNRKLLVEACLEVENDGLTRTHYSWNDDPKRTKEQVYKALDIAEEKLVAQSG